MPDVSGPVATGRDAQFTLTIDEVTAMYARAGHPRTPRSIQRYCASGHLLCLKEATALGDRYFIDPNSVGRHIAQIEELIALDNRANGRDASRQDATVVVAQTLQTPSDPDVSVSAPVGPGRVETPRPDEQRQGTTEDSPSRQVATDADAKSSYVALLEREVEHLKEDKDFLRGQVRTKDEQIAALLERDRETNILVRGLQQMLSPLLGGGRAAQTDRDAMDG
jgi:FtsZ-binding cell division protein ZapB